MQYCFSWLMCVLCALLVYFFVRVCDIMSMCVCVQPNCHSLALCCLESAQINEFSHQLKYNLSTNSYCKC